MKRGLALYVTGFLLANVSLFAQRANLAQDFFERGERAYNESRYTEALELFTKAIAQQPGFQEAYYMRATTREQLSDDTGALTDYNIFLEWNPEHAEALFCRGALRLKTALYELAREDFLKLLTVPRGETQAILYRKTSFESGVDQIMTTQGARDLIYNYLGLIETKLDRYDNAIVYFDSAIRLNPKDADFFVHRGLAKENKGDLAGAESDYIYASNLDPDHSLAQHNLGALARRQGKTSDIEKYLTAAIERNPDLPFPYQERAYFFLEKGSYTSALKDYNKALSLDNSDPETWTNRGLVKEKLGDLSGAYTDFTRAIEIKAQSERAWLSRGNVLSKMGKYIEATEDYSVAITYWPQYGLAFYNRGIVLQRLGRAKDACADITTAQRLGITIPPRVRAKICDNN